MSGGAGGGKQQPRYAACHLSSLWPPPPPLRATHRIHMSSVSASSKSSHVSSSPSARPSWMALSGTPVSRSCRGREGKRGWRKRKQRACRGQREHGKPPPSREAGRHAVLWSMLGLSGRNQELHCIPCRRWNTHRGQQRLAWRQVLGLAAAAGVAAAAALPRAGPQPALWLLLQLQRVVACLWLPGLQAGPWAGLGKGCGDRCHGNLVPGAVCSAPAMPIGMLTRCAACLEWLQRER